MNKYFKKLWKNRIRDQVLWGWKQMMVVDIEMCNYLKLKNWQMDSIVIERVTYGLLEFELRNCGQISSENNQYLCQLWEMKGRNEMLLSSVENEIWVIYRNGAICLFLKQCLRLDHLIFFCMLLLFHPNNWQFFSLNYHRKKIKLQ